MRQQKRVFCRGSHASQSRYVVHWLLKPKLSRFLTSLLEAKSGNINLKPPGLWSNMQPTWCWIFIRKKKKDLNRLTLLKIAERDLSHADSRSWKAEWTKLNGNFCVRMTWVCIASSAHIHLPDCDQHSTFRQYSGHHSYRKALASGQDLDHEWILVIFPPTALRGDFPLNR